MGNYAWIIDVDHLFEESEPGEPGWTPNEAGITGPYEATEADLLRLKAGEGDTFQMFDDDGNLYYTGRCVVSNGMTFEDEEPCFGPLDDFGMGNAGCTSITWPGHPERDCG